MGIGSRAESKGRWAYAYLAVGGLLAGFVNGLLGAGGGILAVFALSSAKPAELGEPSDLYANALCVMLPISALSCLRYAIAGNLVTEGFGVYALPAVAGGLLGGLFLGKLKAGVLRKLFGALVIWAGIALIIR